MAKSSTAKKVVQLKTGKSYAFEQGHPSKETARTAYEDTDLSRAIQAYKFFYPTVSGAAIVKGNEQIGLVPNKVFGILDCAPEQLVFGPVNTAAIIPGADGASKERRRIDGRLLRPQSSRG